MGFPWPTKSAGSRSVPGSRVTRPQYDLGVGLTVSTLYDRLVAEDPVVDRRATAGDVPERIAANRAMWDERVPIHVSGDFYGVDDFRSGRQRLAVRSFEVDDLGSVEGRTLLHLQCHFGLDTLSWARLGARVTGLDFSGPAIEAATRLAAEIGIDADFVQAALDDAVTALGGRQFDVVYTGKGALNWLPDIDRWAATCASLVVPGGTFYLSEFHPVTDMFAWETLELERSYFDTSALYDDSPGTYADLNATTVHNATYEWQHPLGSVVTSLIEAGFTIEFLHEYDYTLFPRWPFLVSREDGSFAFPPDMPELPLMYSIRATKPGP
jgi:2-polyprenyl-3-methyl-5-hydroxy-6-metoxy-1,4-benzoquinol methylase